MWSTLARSKRTLQAQNRGSSLARALLALLRRYNGNVCRSIKPLRSTDGTASEDEIREAALQFVRKVSGIRRQSANNASPFDAAVDRIAGNVAELLDALPASRAAPPARSLRVRAERETTL